jgi:hypothetical protein
MISHLIEIQVGVWHAKPVQRDAAYAIEKGYEIYWARYRA